MPQLKNNLKNQVTILPPNRIVERSIRIIWKEAQEEKYTTLWINRTTPINIGGARGVMVIVVGNGLGDTSSNPGKD